MLKDVRNKHVVHDENDWLRATSYAVVRKRGHDQVVGDVNCIVTEGIDTDHIPMLRQIVDTCLAWVGEEFDRRAGVIRTELAARDYDDLMALPGPGFQTPQTSSLGQRR